MVPISHVLDHLSLHMTGSFAGHLTFGSTVTPFGPPNSFGPPTMVAVVVNLYNRVDPMGTFFRFWVPKRSPFFSRSPLSPFQAEERAKSQSSHYLLNVDHLNTCDDKTSFNESHANLSVKLSFVLKYSNTCMCFLLCISRN